MQTSVMSLPKTAARIASSVSAAAVLLVAAFMPVSAAPGGGQPYRLPGKCIELKVPVSLGDGMPYDQKLAATYCQPKNWAAGPHQIDVLTAGATYTTSYWNWPVRPEVYSYVGKTLAAGRATLAYDRIGTGESSRPLSTQLTLDAEAYVLHSIVKVLHFGGYGFQQINSIGHSYGSGIVIKEATTDYGDNAKVSRVVITGYLHDPRNPIVATRNYQANQDPKFAGEGLDDGYLTSRPGTRGISFYSAAGEADVIAYDEIQKDVVPRTGFIGYAAQQGAPAGSNMSNSITVPVLAVTGQQDLIFCSDPAVLDCTNQAAVQAYEAPYYTGAPNFTSYTVPNTGHDVALHPSADDSFDQINSWIRTH